jgi:hypothetical protein
MFIKCNNKKFKLVAGAAYFSSFGFFHRTIPHGPLIHGLNLFEFCLGLKRKRFFPFSRKSKMSKFSRNFAKFVSRKFSFSQKNFVIAKFCCENENFLKSFRLRVKGKFCCDKLPRKFYILTSILVHVYGYCLLCFESLSGFDHPVWYLYNKTAVSFV